MYKQALTAGSVFAALAVVLGAFGAHALKAKLSAEMLQAFETGVRYQFYHSLGLLITGIVYLSFASQKLRLASVLFIVGIVLFSGSLYAMALMSMNGVSLGPVGVITPVGGLCFIVGWVLFLLGIMQKKAA